ncbi:MAG: NAD-dependent malic enzyme, partial [Pirellulales bacterium]|nr:NAD-dependent malic enzyme [Pirellulales bacterium]
MAIQSVSALATSLTGTQLIDTPLLNKGTAFTKEERHLLLLEGLLPPHYETLDEQIARCYEAFSGQPSDLEKHVYLRNLQDTNETLFYRLMLEHISEMMPIIYTPIVGLACQ